MAMLNLSMTFLLEQQTLARYVVPHMTGITFSYLKRELRTLSTSDN